MPRPLLPDEPRPLTDGEGKLYAERYPIAPRDARYCYAQSRPDPRDGRGCVYACTRHAGHDGLHVGHATSARAVALWADPS